MKKRIITVLIVIAVIAVVAVLAVMDHKLSEDTIYKNTEKARQFKEDAEKALEAVGGKKP